MKTYAEEIKMNFLLKTTMTFTLILGIYVKTKMEMISTLT